MPIEFSCPQCQKKFSVKAELAGRPAKCPCGARVKVPERAPEPEPAVADDLWDELDDGSEYEVEPPEESLLDSGANPYLSDVGSGAGLNSVFETSRGMVELHGLVYTEFVRRVIAAVMDIAFCLIITIIVGLPFILICASTKNALFIVPVILISPPLWLAYLTWMDCSRWHASLGKQCMSSMCTYMDGSPITLKTGIVRTLARFVTLLTGGLGFLTVLFTPQHQALHDLIAGTVVTRTQMNERAIFRRQRKQQKAR